MTLTPELLERIGRVADEFVPCIKTDAMARFTRDMVVDFARELVEAGILVPAPEKCDSCGNELFAGHYSVLCHKPNCLPLFGNREIHKQAPQVSNPIDAAAQLATLKAAINYAIKNFRERYKVVPTGMIALMYENIIQTLIEVRNVPVQSPQVSLQVRQAEIAASPLQKNASKDVTEGQTSAETPSIQSADSEARCGLCGELMPKGEEMFNYHGYSGPCPASQVSHTVGASVPSATYVQLKQKGAQEMLESIRGSLRSYPNGGGDIEVMAEVERIIKQSHVPNPTDGAKAERRKIDCGCKCYRGLETITDGRGFCDEDDRRKNT